MEVIHKSPQKIILRIEANETLANAFRRSISQIPTLAIEEVEIFKNDSALYDEVLAHRLGLVPLKTEKNMSSKTKIDLKISKEGPCTVYSGDLKGNAEVVNLDIPLTLLGEGHTLELVATATLGKGIDHAKHIPGLCFYRHLLEVKSSAENDAIVQKSKSLFKPEKKASNWICDLNDAQVNEIIKKDKTAIKDSPELLFIIESFGQMDAKDILLKSIEALEENLKSFTKVFE